MPLSEDERTQARLGRYDEQAAAYSEAAVKFSQLAVTNLVLINAGGLLALANGIFNAHVHQVGVPTQTAVWFVSGLVAGIVCAYVAYLNFGCLAQQQRSYRAAEDWGDAKRRLTMVALEKSIPFDQQGFLNDGRSLNDFAAECDRITAQETKTAKELVFWVNSTFGAGQVFGIVSMVCFAAACLVMVGNGIAPSP